MAGGMTALLHALAGNIACTVQQPCNACDACLAAAGNLHLALSYATMRLRSSFATLTPDADVG